MVVSHNVQQQLFERVEVSPEHDGAYHSGITDVNKKLIGFLALLILKLKMLLLSLPNFKCDQKLPFLKQPKILVLEF